MVMIKEADFEVKLKELHEQIDSTKLLADRKTYAQTTRQKNPTTWEMINSSSSTRYNRQKETTSLLEYIHGGSEWATYGAWDSLCRLASSKQMEQFILAYKKGRWFEKGMNQAIATKYSLHLSGRRYTFMCKIQAATFNTTSQDWKTKQIRYGDENVKKFVKTLDIGEIPSLPGYCGAFRTITTLCTMIVELHLRTDSLRKKLRWFNDIENHFIMEFSDDGAPETRDLTMGIGSLTCWNFGSRVRSRDYPIHTISAKEKDDVLWQQHTEEMELLEGNVIVINNERITQEFQPSADQAWQFWANNELTQSATYPSMFAKVHKSELTIIGGRIGNSPDCAWNVPTTESREEDLKKL